MARVDPCCPGRSSVCEPGEVLPVLGKGEALRTQVYFNIFTTVPAHLLNNSPDYSYFNDSLARDKESKTKTHIYINVSWMESGLKSCLDDPIGY